MDKKICTRCGKCCREVFFKIDNAYTEEGLDHMEWAQYHGFKTAFRNNSEGKRFWGIDLQAKCIHLREENGKTFCAIYENRPLMCRDYTGENDFSDCGYNQTNPR